MSGPRVAGGRALARAALFGNPSDGYGGRTRAADEIRAAFARERCEVVVPKVA